MLINGITDGIYRQDWYLPIILIKSINTVIKNIHCTVCRTYLIDNLMNIYFVFNENVELIVNLIVPLYSWTMKLGGGGGVCHTN